MTRHSVDKILEFLHECKDTKITVLEAALKVGLSIEEREQLADLILESEAEMQAKHGSTGVAADSEEPEHVQRCG